MAKFVQEKMITLRYPAKEYDALKAKIIKAGLRQKYFNYAMVKLANSDKDIFDKIVELAKEDK